MTMRRVFAAMVIAASVAGLTGCGAGHGSDKPQAPPGPPRSAASTSSSSEASALRSRDFAKGGHSLPSTSAYVTKWSYLQRVCTQQGASLEAIVERVYRDHHEPNRYQAMNYMSALQSPPQSSCASFR